MSVGALDLDRELDLLRVGREERRARGGDVPGHALTHLGHEILEALLLVLLEELASERDRHEGVVVVEEHVHPAVVIVDDRAELGRDGGADLGDVAQRVELGGEAVEHVELGDGPEPVRAALAIQGGHRHVVSTLRSRCSHSHRSLLAKCRNPTGGA